MKIQVTKKAIKERYDIIIGVRAYDMQTLLQFENPFAYSARSEGWACDYYEKDGIVFSTGYAPIKSTVKIKDLDSIIEKYETEAKAIKTDFFQEYQEKINRLLDELIAELKSNI